MFDDIVQIAMWSPCREYWEMPECTLILKTLMTLLLRFEH